jgi:hypothetical protein
MEETRSAATPRQWHLSHLNDPDWTLAHRRDVVLGSDQKTDS